ncbi:thymidine kinase [Stappia sp. ICDLI1TA098]
MESGGNSQNSGSGTEADLFKIGTNLMAVVEAQFLTRHRSGKLRPSPTLREVKTICRCGRKATMVSRIDGGEQVVIVGEDRYVSLRRRHWRERDLGHDRAGARRAEPEAAV